MDLAQTIELCQRSHANPLAVAASLDAATNKEWREWGVDMLAKTLKLGDDHVAQLDKVLGCQVAVTNPDVFEDWHLFQHVCTAFNHRQVNFEWLDEPKIYELAWACICLRALQPALAFDMEVLKYIAANCTTQGLFFFPWIGGEGLSLYDPDLSLEGLFDPAMKSLVEQVKAAWQAGNLPAEMPENETSPFHVQLAHIVGAETYIKAQEKVE